jgi:hypothetical protein
VFDQPTDLILFTTTYRRCHCQCPGFWIFVLAYTAEDFWTVEDCAQRLALLDFAVDSVPIATPSITFSLKLAVFGIPHIPPALSASPALPPEFSVEDMAVRQLLVWEILAVEMGNETVMHPNRGAKAEAESLRSEWQHLG